MSTIITLAECLRTSDKELKNYCERELRTMYGEEAANNFVKYLNKEIEECPIAVSDEKGMKMISKLRGKDHVLSDRAMKEMEALGSFMYKKSHEHLVDKYKKFISYLITRNYATYVETHYEELFQQGVVGLLEAFKTYNYTTKMNTWSRFYIIHELNEYIMGIQNISTTYFQKSRKVIKNIVDNSEDVTMEELVEKSGYSEKVVKAELEAMNRDNPSSIYDEEFQETSIVSRSRSAEDIVMSKLAVEDALRMIRRMDPVTQKILTMKYQDDCDLNEIAKRTGLKPTQVYYKINCAKKILSA